MSLEELREFWISKSIVFPTDLLGKTEDGKWIISVDVMQRVSDEYGVPFEKKDVYTIEDAQFFLFMSEMARRQAKSNEAQEEPKTNVELPQFRVKKYIEALPEDKKTDLDFIASELVARFGSVNVPSIRAGLALAEQEGLLLSAQDLFDKYVDMKKVAAFKRSLVIISGKGLEEEQAIEIAKIMAYRYKDGQRYRDMAKASKEAFKDHPEFSKMVEDKFYEEVAPIIAARYKDTKFRGQLLANKLYADFCESDTLDMSRVFDILDQNIGFDLASVKKQVYAKDKERLVINVLLEGSKNKWDGETISRAIADLNISYPIEFIEATIKGFEGKLVLPYDEIYANLKNPKFKKTNELTPEELLNDILRGYQIGGSDEAEVEAEAEAEREEPVAEAETGEEVKAEQPKKPQKRKMKVTKRERAKNKAQRRATVGLFFAALGAISTTVLVSQFGIHPLEAAKNAVTNISAIISGNFMNHQLFFPLGFGLTQQFVTVATTFAGTLAWLKNRKKYKRLKDEMEEIEFEKDEREIALEEEAEKGRVR